MSKLTLLTTSNPKTTKGESRGYLTAALHLAPFTTSGRNVCPHASAGCAAACLNTAGRGGIAKGNATMENGLPDNPIQRCRLRRTHLFFEDRRAFLVKLSGEIQRHTMRAWRLGLLPAVRLNATSDIRWERVAPRLFTNHPSVIFYDYTKDSARMIHRVPWPLNYDLTFSRSESNEANVRAVLSEGGRVAVVFNTKHGRELPKTWAYDYTMRPRECRTVVDVVDGDEHDLRFLDPQGVVVGLRAKGRAKHDTSGFVVCIDTDETKGERR